MYFYKAHYSRVQNEWIVVAADFTSVKEKCVEFQVVVELLVSGGLSFIQQCYLKPATFWFYLTQGLVLGTFQHLEKVQLQCVEDNSEDQTPPNTEEVKTLAEHQR
ncbi:uncharacterized protein V6R79_006228 [Siganus canaliculatus]